MSIAMNEYGDVVEVTEQSPYDMSSVAKVIPMADYMPVDTKFNPLTTFKEQALNAIEATNWDNVRKVAEGIKREQEMRNADVLEAYRFKIACDQNTPEVQVSTTLLNKAFTENTGYADFNRLDISNIVYRGGGVNITRPQGSPTDWSPLVPGDAIRSNGALPDSLPGRRDVSNTWKGGQMSGHRSINAEKWGTGMGFSFDDLWSHATSEAEKKLEEEAMKLISQTINPTIPQATTPSGATVVQAPAGAPVQTTMQTITSSVDPKILIYAGIGLAGLVVLLAVLRR